MKIATKITLGAFSLTTLAVATVALGIAATASRQVESGLVSARSDQMTSLWQVTRTAVEAFGQGLENQLLNLATQQWVGLATEDLTGSFGGYALFAGEQRVDQHRQALATFLGDAFSQRFIDHNPGAEPPVTDWVRRLSDNAVTLQRHFTVDPDWEERADRAEARVDSSYNNHHRRHHPAFRRFQQRFGLDDILIIHPEDGTLVYSTGKDIDLGTSLLEGPFRDSALAGLYRNSRDLAVGETRFADFAPYAPALGQPRAFLATPVPGESGEPVGLLVFRLDAAALTRLVSYDHRWRASGLGETGATYLVGADGRLRSNRRGLLEGRTNYQQRLIDAGVKPADARTILAMGTAVAREPATLAVVDAALDGNADAGVSHNRHGEALLAAHGPVDFLGERWALISQIERGEALANLGDLQRAIRHAALSTAGVLTVLAALAGGWLARSMIRPIEQTTATLRTIAAGDGDLTQRLDERRPDELGQLAIAFNRFVEHIHGLVVEVRTVKDRLVDTTAEVRTRAEAAIESLESQNHQTDQVGTAMQEMARAVQEMSDHATQADRLSRDSRDQARQGVRVVEDLATTVEQMAHRTGEARSTLARLDANTRSITAVLDVIRSIAEQTNLLALNAAIEAARAGDQGRGFAVVADQVRTLANRSQASAEEIHAMIETLQTGSAETVRAMEAGHAAVADGNARAGHASDTLSTIAASMDQIQQANVSIASAIEEQSLVASDISQALQAIGEVAHATGQGSREIRQSVTELTNLTGRLNALLERFRTDA